MFKICFLACLLAIASANPLIYSPTYYTALASHVPVSLPLTYAAGPAAASETYNSVATQNSFQQQYRSDYKPLTYSAALIY